ncbi:cobalamin 5'-phosphate synthase [Aphanomyces invadans]|uniref:Adenosylcobinamide-GDP ribazoletransferase n=1 Tax=Aphanomyces invadans TaxID=157072 RepID=A0A024TEA3_9STRA|nr:cobalamin 5'-phosphate synthase [Aphanomyces invadans]ETV92373.1 cobalamin 5'-phosphate synthase [Aphanomyces invadans]|eukprot:XP_008878924.1 cobalamin 5'-phosphate synthase [Aphanomyces invadans]
MAGLGHAELRDAMAGRFGDIGILEGIAQKLCALQETFAVRVENPVLVVFTCNDDATKDEHTASRVAALSDVTYHTVHVAHEDSSLDTEQVLKAMHHGRDAIKVILANGVHKSVSVASLDTSPEFTSRLSKALALPPNSAPDSPTNSAYSPILKHEDPFAMLVATRSPIVAAICGAIAEAASQKVPVVLDGLAAVVAAVIATYIAPQATRHAFFAVRSIHTSNEVHRADPCFESLLQNRSIMTLPLPRLGPGASGIHALSLLHTAERLVLALNVQSPTEYKDRNNDASSVMAATTSTARAAHVDGSLPPPPELRIFLTSVMFLTRLPAYKIIPDLDHNVRELVPSFCYFPFIGWGVGAFAALWLVLGHVVFGSTAIAVILSTFASVWLTGCFHEDGVADTFDSFGGGWSKDDILRIMKDSRLGTYGCMGLLLMTALKFAVLAHLVATVGLSSVSCALVAGHVLGRYSSLFILQFYPYVEDERDPKGPLYNGIGNNVHLLTPWRVWVASIFTAVSMAILLGPALGMCVFTVALLVSFVSGQYFSGFLGGVIGDCLGCANQVVEIVAYMTISAILNSATRTHVCTGST